MKRTSSLLAMMLAFICLCSFSTSLVATTTPNQALQNKYAPSVEIVVANDLQFGIDNIDFTSSQGSVSLSNLPARNKAVLGSLYYNDPETITASFDLHGSPVTVDVFVDSVLVSSTTFTSNGSYSIPISLSGNQFVHLVFH